MKQKKTPSIIWLKHSFKYSFYSILIKPVSLKKNLTICSLIVIIINNSFFANSRKPNFNIFKINVYMCYYYKLYCVDICESIIKSINIYIYIYIFVSDYWLAKVKDEQKRDEFLLGFTSVINMYVIICKICMYYHFDGIKTYINWLFIYNIPHIYQSIRFYVSLQLRTYLENHPGHFELFQVLARILKVKMCLIFLFFWSRSTLHI